MTAPRPLEPTHAAPPLRVVGDDERAPTPDGMKARDTDRRHPATAARPPARDPLAAFENGTVDWVAVALLTMVGGAGVTGLLSYLLPGWLCLALYAVAIAVPVCRYAVTTRRRDGAR